MALIDKASILEAAKAALTGQSAADVAADRERSRLARLEAPDSMLDRAAAHATWMQDALAVGNWQDWASRRLLTEQLATTLRSATPEQQQAMVARALTHLTSSQRMSSLDPDLEVLRALRARRLPWTAAEVAWMLHRCAHHGGLMQYFRLTCASLPLTAAGKLPDTDLPLLTEALKAVTAAARADGDSADATKIVARVQALLDKADPEGADAADTILADDQFGPTARTHLQQQTDAATLSATLRHLTGYGSAVTPSRAWEAATTTVLTAHPAAPAVCRSLLDLVATHREYPTTRRFGQHEYTAQEFVSPNTAALLRGATWVLAASGPSPADVATIGRAAAHCGTGFGGSGGQPRCQQVTSSAASALERVVRTDPALATPVVAALAGVLDKVANKSLRAAVDRALVGVADAAGLTRGQLLERAVPTFDLDAGGTATIPAGDHTAVVTLTHGPSGAKLVTTWRTPAGKTVKTTPAVVKEQHADVLAQLRGTAAQVKKVAASQRMRLEELLAADQTWAAEEWAAYYPGHPVVGLYARALIWQVDTGDGDWFGGLPTMIDGSWALTNHDGTTRAVADTDRMRLWHPIRQGLDDIKAWRAHLDDTGLRQPFKQAFREIYLLTPAEEGTDTYSNRFAAHILRYPQAGALIRTRGWAGQHLGYWDGGFEATATKEFAGGQWRASFDYALVERDEDQYERVSLASTDQVRFAQLRERTWQLAHLRDVPPLVFSEAMRDVDLFVGVTSIAADPTWNDRGTAAHRDYWHQASFGDLTESAQVRRDALAQLLPKTSLAGKVELEERFLRVRGHLRDYRIHLGSTNILMSPADTYLCIVPARDPKDPKVFLPFEEGGGKLSVILSKAFLLADDTSITDPSITRQLRNGL